MMIRIIILIIGLFGIAHAQTVTPNAGPYQQISTKYQYTWQKWAGGIWNTGKMIQEDSAYFGGITYVPTALSNDSNTRAANTGWVRQWIATNITPGIAGQGTQTWNTGGNYSPVDPTPYRLGFRDNISLHFMTDNVIRATIPGSGITRRSNAADKCLVQDTITKIFYYTDCGSGGGTGTVTQVNSGLGLSGGPITNTGTIALDTSSSVVLSRQRAANTYMGGTLANNRGVIFNNGGLIKDTSTFIYSSGNLGINESSPASTLHISGNSLGVAENLSAGGRLYNSTAATLGNQQKSPIWLFGGMGYATTPAASREVLMWCDLLPVQGTTNPTGLFRFNSKINNGTTVVGATIGTDGSFISSGTGLFSGTVTSNSAFSTVGSVTAGANGFTGGKYTSNTTVTYSTGTNTFNAYEITGGVNTTGGTNIYRGLYLNIGVPSTTGTTVYGVVQTNGINGFNTSNGSTNIGTVTPTTNAIFKVASTTQASIPFPIMTSAQRTAITSPSVGMHVYQSDGTEGVYVYKSAGWAFAY